MPFFENMLRKTNAKFDIMAPIKPEAVKSRMPIQGPKNNLQTNQEKSKSNPYNSSSEIMSSTKQVSFDTSNLSHWKRKKNYGHENLKVKTSPKFFLTKLG